jgi:hypothetical protein
MVMKLASQNSFQGSPKGTRPQVAMIIRRKHDLRLVAAWADLIRASKRSDAAFDPEMLFDNVKLHEVGRLNNHDALDEMSSIVSALDGGANASLVAFGSHRVRQQEAQEERRTNGDVLVQQHLSPNHFRGFLKVSRGRNHLNHSVSREQPTDEPEPSRCFWFHSRHLRFPWLPSIEDCSVQNGEAEAERLGLFCSEFIFCLQPVLHLVAGRSVTGKIDRIGSLANLFSR